MARIERVGQDALVTIPLGKLAREGVISLLAQRSAGVPLRSSKDAMTHKFALEVQLHGAQLLALWAILESVPIDALLRSPIRSVRCCVNDTSLPIRGCLGTFQQFGNQAHRQMCMAKGVGTKLEVVTVGRQFINGNVHNSAERALAMIEDGRADFITPS